MNNKYLALLITMLLIATAVYAVTGITKEQRTLYNACKKNCSTTKMLDKRDCNLVAQDCRNACREQRSDSDSILDTDYALCRSSCNNLSAPQNTTFNVTNTTLSNITKQMQLACKRNCTAFKRDAKKNTSETYNGCVKVCQTAKQDCKQIANDDFTVCRASCMNLSHASNTTYSPGNTSDNLTNSTGNDQNSTNEDGNLTEQHLEQITCSRPYRIRACIEQYDPVCSQKKVTYANGCYACNDRKVRWYTEGSCASG